MTFDEQYEALCALGAGPPTWTYHPEYKDRCTAWVASMRVEIQAGASLTSASGRGTSVEDALSDLWTRLTDLPDGQTVRIGGFGPDRKNCRWNGFMWRENEFMWREMSVQSDEQPYCCLDCGDRFDTADEMDDHITAQHNEGYGENGLWGPSMHVPPEGWDGSRPLQ